MDEYDQLPDKDDFRPLRKCSFCGGAGTFPPDRTKHPLWTHKNQTCPLCRGAGQLTTYYNLEDITEEDQNPQTTQDLHDKINTQKRLIKQNTDQRRAKFLEMLKHRLIHNLN